MSLNTPTPEIKDISDLPELISRSQLAIFTGLAEQTFNRWATEGKGPRITKLGGRVRYRKQHVIDWLKDSEQITPAAV